MISKQVRRLFETFNTSSFTRSVHPFLMRLKADLTLLIVSVIWGSAFVAQRVAGQLGSVYFFNGALSSRRVDPQS
jgi:hypothetical protein